LFLGAFLSIAALPGASAWGQQYSGDRPGELTLDDDAAFDDGGTEVYDPLEGFNRGVFKLNDWVYKRIFNPLEDGYDFIVPNEVAKRIHNVARMAATPKRMVNHLFQLNFKQSAVELGRLLINASVGIAGFFDPAEHFLDLEERDTDFDRTMARYGVGKGAYLMVPIIGPTTVRGVLGSGVDYFLSPFTWFGIYDVEEEIAFRAFNGTKRVNSYSYRIRNMYERITEAAIDPYIAVQDAYIQHLDKDIRDPFEVEQ
jgi:phospholipid-binding lipoprotein MlaA